MKKGSQYAVYFLLLCNFIFLTQRLSAQVRGLNGDSSFLKRIHDAVFRLGDPKNPANSPEKRNELIRIFAAADTINQKYTFLSGVANVSFFGGGKSGQEIKNYMLSPLNGLRHTIFFILDSIKEPTITTTQVALVTVDRMLNELYLSSFQNKHLADTVAGDDNENNKVEVSVKVYETYAGRKEVSGYSVYIFNPFVKNSREDFNPTVFATKMISPGWRYFHIERKKRTQEKYFHVVYKDENTHTVIFAEQP